jgi:broad specificity phosphatase PhoE
VGAVIYLVRHGQTEMNLAQLPQGCRMDSPLTALGEAQARVTGEILKRLFAQSAVPPVVSSPMGRARATTAIILATLGLPPEAYAVDDRLRELDYGDWTGMSRAEVLRTYPVQRAARERDPWNEAPANGESYGDVAVRAAAWLRAHEGDVIAVAHGTLGRILRGVVLGLDGVAIRALAEPHDCVFRIADNNVECFGARESPGG